MIECIKYEEEIEDILQKMTLDEKIGMIHGSGIFHTAGVPRLGIPPLIMSDGPMGVRSEFEDNKFEKKNQNDDFVTYLPCNAALAATFNSDLSAQYGKVLGSEARGRGKDVILGPGINIKRTPLCGRNFEYMSEDPYLTKELVVPLIKGIQENDVAACVKHFAANAQETERMWIDTIIDERTLQEIYLPAFKAAVTEASSYSIMGAYNLLNGTHCCENKVLMDELLRKAWKYDGVVISDWCAVHNTEAAATCSLDIEMSVNDNFDDYYLAAPLKKEIQEGRIEEKYVNQKVRNILRLMFRLKMLGENKSIRKPGNYNLLEHRSITRKIADQSIVLLKNSVGKLPLDKKSKRICVIGHNGICLHASGGGSAEINALYEISPLMGIKMLLGGNTVVDYYKGYYIPKIDESEEEISKKQDEYLKEALANIEQYDEVLFIGGLDHNTDVEGYDKDTLELPYDQNTCIEKILEKRKDACIILIGGGPVEMPWIDKADTLVWSYYAGMEGGSALADILFGEVNPSGKLPETFPKRYDDIAAIKSGQFTAKGSLTYEEGIFVGYRYYDKEQIKPLFCFGHGLSYTQFSFSDFHVSKDEQSNKVNVCFQIQNIGTREGYETIQIYVSKRKSLSDKEKNIQRAERELKAFTKICLQPGEKIEKEFVLNLEAFSYYDEKKQGFIIEKGVYDIGVGDALDTLQLAGECQFS